MEIDWLQPAVLWYGGQNARLRHERSGFKSFWLRSWLGNSEPVALSAWYILWRGCESEGKKDLCVLFWAPWRDEAIWMRRKQFELEKKMESSQVLNSQGDGRPHGYRVGSQPKEVRIMCCINSAVCAGAVPSQTPLKHVLLLSSLWHKVQEVLGTFV